MTQDAAKAARVLVVDDTAANVKLLADLLTYKGYEVATAASGEEGLRKLAEQRPDIVLLDIMMPGMNGIEALAKLRSDPETKAIPVFAFTASVMPQDRKEITSAGFDGFLSKPINLKEFLETINAAMAGKKP